MNSGGNDEQPPQLGESDREIEQRFKRSGLKPTPGWQGKLVDLVATIKRGSAAPTRESKPAGPAFTGDPPPGWQAPLVDLLAAIARCRALVVVLLVLGFIGGMLKLKTTPPFYKASTDAILLPREKPPVDISVSVGSLESAADGARREDTGGMMLPANPELYTGLAHSEPVLLSIAERFADRIHFADDDRSVEISTKLRSMFKITGTDDGLLTAEATANDAALAADLANAMMEEMERASKLIERGLIVRQAGFLGDAIVRIEGDLMKDQESLSKFYQGHSIVDLGTQVVDILRMIRETRMTKIALEQKVLQRLASYSEADATVQSMRGQIVSLEENIESMHHDYFGKYSQDEFGGILIEYEALRDRVRYSRDLVATLKSQQSVFEIRAEQPAGSLAIIRSAAPSLRPAGPSTKKVLGLFMALSLVLAIGLTLLFEQVRLARAEPYIADRLGEIQRTLGNSPTMRLVRRLPKPAIFKRRPK